MAQDAVKFWILGDDGEKYGPIGLKELREWVVENRVGPDSQAALDVDGAPSGRWQRLDLYSESAALWEARESGAEVLAPLWRRLVAGVIDMVFIFTLIGGGLSWVLMHGLGLGVRDIERLSEAILEASASGGYSDAVASLMWMVNVLGYVSMGVYFGYFHLRREGRTLGGVLCGLRVVSEDGRAMGVGQALLRTAGLVVTISFYGLGFIFVFFTRRRQALQDLVSGTVVVKNRVEK